MWFTPLLLIYSMSLHMYKYGEESIFISPYTEMQKKKESKLRSFMVLNKKKGKFYKELSVSL